MRHRKSTLNNPPAGLAEDYCDGHISLPKLAVKYHIGITRVYQYSRLFGWKRKKCAPQRNQRTTDAFLHIRRHGEVSELPSYSSFPEFAVDLCKSFPKHWSKPPSDGRHKKSTYDPTATISLRLSTLL